MFLIFHVPGFPSSWLTISLIYHVPDWLISCAGTGHCYVSEAPGPNRNQHRCATERVEAVTSLDILYNRFHEITMATMEASDKKKSCGQKYDCPDGEPDCETRHFIVLNFLSILLFLFHYYYAFWIMYYICIYPLDCNLCYYIYIIYYSVCIIMFYYSSCLYLFMYCTYYACRVSRSDSEV